MTYTEADDGKVIQGATIVWLRAPAAADAAGGEAKDGDSAEAGKDRAASGSRPSAVAAEHGPDSPKLPDAPAKPRPAPVYKPAVPLTPAGLAKVKASTEDAAAAALTSAAETGVPFCKDCEAARQALLAGAS